MAEIFREFVQPLPDMWRDRTEIYAATPLYHNSNLLFATHPVIWRSIIWNIERFIKWVISKHILNNSMQILYVYFNIVFNSRISIKNFNILIVGPDCEVLNFRWIGI
jgi:hypothetical protein